MAEQQPHCGQSYRTFVVFLAAIGMAIMYATRVNISPAMVAMVNTTAQQLGHSKTVEQIDLLWEGDHARTHDCDFWNITHEGATYDGPFIWTEKEVAFVFSSYYIGYVLALIPGGRAAELWSVKGVFTFSITVNVIMALLTPMFTHISYNGLLFVQFMKGIGGGVVYPSGSVIVAHWAPAAERSYFSTVIFGGSSLGTVFAISFTSEVCARLGWEWAFYLMGLLAAPWVFLWVIFMSDYPETSIWISEEEKTKITTERPMPKPNLSIPFKAIFTSPPFLAVIACHILFCCGYYLLLTNLPIYMRQMLNFSLAEVRYLSAIPYLLMFFASVGMGKLMTSMIKAEKISVTTARKVSSIICSAVPGLCLVIICFMGCHRWYIVILFTIALTSMGTVYCGVLCNHVDLAPNFAGTLMSISGSIGNCAGIVVPMMVGYITENNQTTAAWRVVFFITTGFLALMVFVYGIFGSGELQPWNEGKQGTSQT